MGTVEQQNEITKIMMLALFMLTVPVAHAACESQSSWRECKDLKWFGKDPTSDEGNRRRFGIPNFESNGSTGTMATEASADSKGQKWPRCQICSATLVIGEDKTPCPNIKCADGIYHEACVRQQVIQCGDHLKCCLCKEPMVMAKDATRIGKTKMVRLSGGK